ncbi:MAG: metal ABC transporter permease [Parachlamydiales bacterium]|nr:metal ABC transporter permease [Verrucomicrobiota bacterium]MBX3720188.1 metal ABC transporter permease [Candidatus Acheromyda pituitae]
MVETSFFQAIAKNPFLLLALFAGLAASFASGIIGSYVVVKRIVAISGSIAHSVLGGMGIFLWLKRTYGWEILTPLYGALFAGLLSALLMGWIHLKYKEREDTVIAALWATGMSVGVIFIALTPGYNVELLNFLFGNILWVTHSDIRLLLILDILIIGLVALFYRRFLAICFDEDQAQLQGMSVRLLYLLLLCLVAISVVLLIQVVGAILVIAMLAIPAAVAGTLSQRLSSMMLLAVLLGCVFTTAGMYAAYELNWPPGATISLFAACVYSLSLLMKKRIKK